MDNNIEKQLLEVIKENLTGANVKAIENIIAENKKVKDDNKELVSKNKVLHSEIIQVELRLDILLDKEKLSDNIINREEALIHKENLYEVKVANHEKNILQVKLDNALQSKTDIYHLSEVLFKNRNIHHMINTYGNMPVPTGQGESMNMPFNSTTNKITTDDNGE